MTAQEKFVYKKLQECIVQNDLNGIKNLNYCFEGMVIKCIEKNKFLICIIARELGNPTLGKNEILKYFFELHSKRKYNPRNTNDFVNFLMHIDDLNSKEEL